MPCLIVGTQTDLRDDAGVRDKLAKQRMQPVRREDGERMAKDLGAVKYVECSALTQFKLKDVFDEVRSFPLNFCTQACNVRAYFNAFIRLFASSLRTLRSAYSMKVVRG